MSRIEKVTREDLVNSMDHTWLTDSLIPKKWKCPHCGRHNTTSSIDKYKTESEDPE